MKPEEIDLSKYVKYARDYLNLSRGFRSGARSEKTSVKLEESIFDLPGLLNGDLDGNISESINLQYFYNAETDEDKETNEYLNEEKIAQGLENLIFKFKNNQFTQELRIKFCYVKYKGRTVDPESGELTVFQDFELPLCSIGIQINKDQKTGLYSLSMTDDQVLVHIEPFWHFVDEKIYYQLTRMLTDREKDSGLFLPKEDLNFVEELEKEVRAAVQTAENFEIKSFEIKKVEVTLEPKSNYFLVEDLEALSKIESDQLEGSSLSIWRQKENEELDFDETSHEEEAELFFPFPYDKFKLRTLPLLRNTVSIIEGPPGTGKSELIANFLVHLAATQKRVLFVSQKSQALKVVKDKLKSLDVDGLFAYFPNKNSSLLSETDFNDSVTAAFTKIERVLDSSIPQASVSEVKKKFADVIDNRSKFAEYFSIQREYYRLSKEIQDNFQPFKEIGLAKIRIDTKLYKNLRDSYEDRVRIEKEVKQFKGESFNLIDSLPLTQKIVDALKRISDDFSGTAYDRTNSLFKTGNNFIRRTRLSSDFKVLPNEINEEIKRIEKKYSSKHDAGLRLRSLSAFIEYSFNKRELVRLKEYIEKILDQSDLTLKRLQLIIALQSETSLTDEDLIEKVHLYQKLEEELKKLGKTSYNPNSFSSTELRNFKERRQRINVYLANILKKRAVGILNSRQSLKIIQRLAKAFNKSKAAYKTFDKLKSSPDEFSSVYSVFPIWIMELDDASRILPLEKDLFDYLILDESSQCDIAFTLPAMFRARNAVFVGDSKQMKSTATGFLSNRVLTQLAEKYEVPDHM